MSLVIRALLPLTRMTWLEILALARAVYAGMDGNPAFPHPPVAMTVFKAAIDEFESSLIDAEDRSGKAIARRNVEARELMKMLRQLAHYVEHNCNNDIITFLSSGFKPVSKSQTAPGPLSQSIRRIDPGENSGELSVTLVRVSGASHHEVRWAPRRDEAAPNEWSSRPVTKVRRVLIKGLTPGVAYAFQARALLESGYTDWSDAVTRICL